MSASVDNTALVTRFYEAFAHGDAAGMNACYAHDIVFEDPAFGELRGDRARAMWTMLCSGLSNFSLTYEILSATESSVRARAVANYTYAATGRRVRNEISSTFACNGSAIQRQTDTFDLWKWSAQALGATGKFLGWSPIVRNKIRSTASGRLDRFINRT